MAETEVAIPGNSAGATGDTEIDLYADVVENELETGTGDDYITHEEHLEQDGDLYDDVITQSSATDFADITNTVNQVGNKMDQANGSLTGRSTPSSGYNGKRVSLYVGQLTWWTTDADLADAIREIGIHDLLEVKFHENRVNGQSKGFAVVTVGSEGSSKTIFEKVPKQQIHGQNPAVFPCNKQSLSFLEGLTRKDAPMEPMAPIGAPHPRPIMRPPIGLPLPMPRGGHMDNPYRFGHQGHVLLPGTAPGLQRPPMHITLGARGPVPGGPMVLSRMPGPAPPNVHPQQPVIVMQRPGIPTGANGPPMVRQPIAPGAPGVPVSSSGMPQMPSQHPPGYYSNQVPQTHSVPIAGQPHADPYYRAVDTRSDPSSIVPISESEFQDIMERNKTVSSSAINRAVQDASAGEYGSAIETLVTAISLIKQSKIANDDRCQILISSLHNTLKGIEEKFYGQRSRHRSRSSSPRESSRKKHRHRSRSPRDRVEYRRSEDHDGKYSREHRRR